jgi:hypothetical protein
LDSLIFRNWVQIFGAIPFIPVSGFNFFGGFVNAIIDDDGEELASGFLSEADAVEWWKDNDRPDNAFLEDTGESMKNVADELASDREER